MLPGSQVKADGILLEMSNPQVEQARSDAQASTKKLLRPSIRVFGSNCQTDLDEPESRRCYGDRGLQSGKVAVGLTKRYRSRRDFRSGIQGIEGQSRRTYYAKQHRG